MILNPFHLIVFIGAVIAVIYLVYNVVFIPRCLVKVVQDDISIKIFQSDCITLYMQFCKYFDQKAHVFILSSSYSYTKVKKCLVYSTSYCSVHWTSNFLQGTRKTRLCLMFIWSGCTITDQECNFFC